MLCRAASKASRILPTFMSTPARFDQPSPNSGFSRSSVEKQVIADSKSPVRIAATPHLNHVLGYIMLIANYR